MSLHLRKELITACRSYVEERMTRITASIGDLQEALKLETKCSMGDKYETGRAMLHLEFEKLSSQLDQLNRLKKTLTLLGEKAPGNKVAFGSLVRTSKANYFLAIPAGQIMIGKENFFAVGTNSPIAQLLLGKKQGERFRFNGAENEILEVC